MALASPWVRENWFALLQSLGIIGGLLFTALSIRRETAARQATDLLALSERHHELWAGLGQRPDLRRVLSTEVDLVAEPVTFSERHFLNLVIVHFSTGWLLAKRGSLVSLETLRSDVTTFFTLPLPKTVWRESRNGRDVDFVKFVESCLITAN
jgi:hypothetical protein